MSAETRNAETFPAWIFHAGIFYIQERALFGADELTRRKSCRIMETEIKTKGCVFMILDVYQKTLRTLAKRPIRLWGLSLLAWLLTWLAGIGFAGIIAVSVAVTLALNVGMDMIYLNSYRTGLEPKTAYLFAAFKKDRFLRVVGGMAWKALWVFLWGLIPIVGPVFAVIRSYEYRFTPYILMTRDDVPTTEAIKVSKKETMGYKGRMFWADVIPAAAVLVAGVILGIFSNIPFVGVLFSLADGLMLLVVSLVCALFYGILHAAFYVEIRTAAARPAAPVAPVIPAPAAPVEEAPAEEAPVEEAPAEEAAAEEAPAEDAPAEVAEEDVTPEEPLQAASAERLCPVCGFAVGEEAKFCTHCGQKL